MRIVSTEYANQVMSFICGEARNKISTHEVFWILDKLQEYLSKSDEREINETAFFTESQFIRNELLRSGMNISTMTLEHILYAESLSYTKKKHQSSKTSKLDFPF